MKRIKILLFFLLLTLVLNLNAQVATLPDVSKINISELSNDQLRDILTKYKLSGSTPQELEKKAADAGFSPLQIDQLKMRLSATGAPAEKQAGNNNALRNADGSNQDRSGSQVPLPRSRVFGSEFFSGNNITFEPNLKIATPGYYILGPGDHLLLSLYGYSEVQYKLEVNPDGYINIPNVGPVLVSGLSIDEARTKIRKQLGNVYAGINNGTTSFQLLLGDIRSIRVTMIGEVQRPGMYTLSSLSTIANALYMSGGPGDQGSFRNIDLMRDGKRIVSFDFYDFLLHGDLSKNILLHDGDIIHVNTYTTKVIISGAVKHPAIFEAGDKDRLQDMIGFAGGYADNANRNKITLYRLGAQEREIISLQDNQLAGFDLKTGDSIVVAGILDRYRNRVAVSGAVFYPGDYALEQAPTLKALLQKAQPKENVFRSRNVIQRKQEDMSLAYINFNLDEILSGKQDITLKREDSVLLYAIENTRETYTVTINGEINTPGMFLFGNNMKLLDLILMAGGFKEAASGKRIEIARRIRLKNNAGADTVGYAIIKIVDVPKDYMSNSELETGQLEPFDVISVRKLPEYKTQMIVKVQGQVKYPGEYVIQHRTEKLSDLVQRAGGLTEGAYAGGAVLLRNTYETKQDSILKEDRKLILKKNSDSITFRERISSDSLSSKMGQKPVGIRLQDAIQSPNSLSNIYLEEGDVLQIPMQPQTVEAFGAVNVSQKIVYRKGIRLQDVIQGSGGFSTGAKKSRIYVIHANGEVNSTHRFLFLRSYPDVWPGDQVFIPSRDIKRNLSTGEIVGLASSITGLAVIIVTLLNLKN